jgi:hypothetical protein
MRTIKPIRADRPRPLERDGPVIEIGTDDASRGDQCRAHTTQAMRAVERRMP